MPFSQQITYRPLQRHSLIDKFERHLITSHFLFGLPKCSCVARRSTQYDSGIVSNQSMRRSPSSDRHYFSIVVRAFNGTGLVSGANVGSVTATDSDTSDTLYFTLLPSPDSGRFSLTSSGATATLTTTTDLDYEATVRDFQLTVRVADRPDTSSSDALCSDLYVATPVCYLV